MLVFTALWVWTVGVRGRNEANSSSAPKLQLCNSKFVILGALVKLYSDLFEAL